jgi:hypothetical protein
MGAKPLFGIRLIQSLFVKTESGGINIHIII